METIGKKINGSLVKLNSYMQNREEQVNALISRLQRMLKNERKSIDKIMEIMEIGMNDKMNDLIGKEKTVIGKIKDKIIQIDMDGGVIAKEKMDQVIEDYQFNGTCDDIDWINQLIRIKNITVKADELSKTLENKHQRMNEQISMVTNE